MTLDQQETAKKSSFQVLPDSFTSLPAASVASIGGSSDA